MESYFDATNKHFFSMLSVPPIKKGKFLTGPTYLMGEPVENDIKMKAKIMEFKEK